jgi:CRP-like cAMP-binding protein
MASRAKIKRMYQNLFNYISDYSKMSITVEEEELIINHFRPKKLRKKQYFLQEGDVSKYTGFITKGAMRQYYTDDNGDEHVINLFVENYWATDRESFLNLTPSTYYIDAWEDTELLMTTRADMLELIKKVPAIDAMIRMMDDRNAIATQKRITSIINNTAEERYEAFVKSHPQFIQRFPQHQIASYLGVTKETLSRVRKIRR